MSILTVAVCTCNRAERLRKLIAELRMQECPVPFEILVVDNNSGDNTAEVVKELAGFDALSVRYVKEEKQGIVHARNCAIDNSKKSKYLAFIDDDELPCPVWMKTAVDALEREGADCVGGEIRVRLPVVKQPKWFEEELLGFLGKLKHGATSFWIMDISTPVWSGNIAYRTSIFSDGLRFDVQYNREGNGIGGGEDAIMFKTLLKHGKRIRYRPDMVIEHLVDEWKLKRSYFIRLHYIAGRNYGQYMTDKYKRSIIGVPPFMFTQALRQWFRAVVMFLRHEQGVLRQAMNGAHATGVIAGRVNHWVRDFINR